MTTLFGDLLMYHFTAATRSHPIVNLVDHAGVRYQIEVVENLLSASPTSRFEATGRMQDGDEWIDIGSWVECSYDEVLQVMVRRVGQASCRAEEPTPAPESGVTPIAGEEDAR